MTNTSKKTIFPLLGVLAISILLVGRLCSGGCMMLKSTYSPKGNKLVAFELVVKTCKNVPDNLSSSAERKKHSEELRAAVDAFLEVPFDAASNREEAKQIIKIYQNELEHRFSGFEYNVIEEEILKTIQRLRE